MEVDPASGSSSPAVPVNVWCHLGAEGTKRFKADLALREDERNLKGLKEFLCRIVGNSVTPDEIEVLHNGGSLRDDAAVRSASFSALNVISVVKRNGKASPKEVASSSSAVSGQVPQIALALRTAFLNPKFVPTVMKMGQSEMLENIMAIAPGLKSDPVGVAIVQDPTMIFHLSDFESLKKLATTRPWVVEAFNFMAASVHQEKGHSDSRGGEASGLFNPALLADDEEMDDDEEGAAGGAAGANRPVFTREQLSRALNSLTALGRGPLSMPTPPATPAASSASVNSSAGAGNSTTDFQNFLQNALGTGTGTGAGAASAGSTGFSPDMVARAMTTALNSLPPDARNAQLSQLREQVARIQQMTGGSGVSSGNSSSVPAQPTPTPAVSQYASQLQQMRDMGINDERLSRLALRVSDGDVQTAVELIFSGWTGEGADVDMPDEE